MNHFVPADRVVIPETREGTRVGRRWPVWSPFGLLTAGVLLMTLGMWAADHMHGRAWVPVFRWTWAGAAVCGALSVVVAFKVSRRLTSDAAQVALAFNATAGLLMSAIGALAALFAGVQFTRGRQLRSFGRVLLPPVAQDGAWASVPPAEPVADTAVAPALAAQWRENGRTEHASVAAFARLTLDLMALGAPPSLVKSCQADALDEIRHTELCFSLARAIDGRAASPGPFPAAARARTLSSVRTIALGQLAVDSLIDGALHEGVSARIVAKLARRAESPAVASMLREIAADEGRHAAHGWHVVAWCIAEGGEPVAHALRAALRALPERMDSSLPAAAEDGSWERYGIAGQHLESEEFARGRADVVRRLDSLLALPRAA